MRRILYLAQAEVLHILRDHILLAQVLVVPVVQLLILSNAATFEIRNTPIHVVDLDRSTASRGVVNRLAANGHFQIVDTTPSTDRADERLVEGTATIAVVIPHDFETSLVRTGVAEVQLVVNAEKGSAAGIVQSYATQVLTGYASELSVVRPRIDVRVRPLYNTTQNYKHYMRSLLRVSTGKPQSRLSVPAPISRAADVLHSSSHRFLPVLLQPSANP